MRALRRVLLLPVPNSRATLPCGGALKRGRGLSPPAPIRDLSRWSRALQRLMPATSTRAAGSIIPAPPPLKRAGCARGICAPRGEPSRPARCWGRPKLWSVRPGGEARARAILSVGAGIAERNPLWAWCRRVTGRERAHQFGFALRMNFRKTAKKELCTLAENQQLRVVCGSLDTVSGTGTV